MFQEFGLDVFEHPAQSQYLDPSDFHFFSTFKELLGCRRFKSYEEVKESVKQT
jgi:hypothetical protein